MNRILIFLSFLLMLGCSRADDRVIRLEMDIESINNDIQIMKRNYESKIDALEFNIKSVNANIEIPKKIESYLLGELGLSSTGKIQVIGNYHLTQKSKLGQENDKVLHIIQKDLLGERLFWSCLVNQTQERVLLLYRCQKPDESGKLLLIR